MSTSGTASRASDSREAHRRTLASGPVFTRDPEPPPRESGERPTHVRSGTPLSCSALARTSRLAARLSCEPQHPANREETRFTMHTVSPLLHRVRASASHGFPPARHPHHLSKITLEGAAMCRDTSDRLLPPTPCVLSAPALSVSDLLDGNLRCPAIGGGAFSRRLTPLRRRHTDARGVLVLRRPDMRVRL